MTIEELRARVGKHVYSMFGLPNEGLDRGSEFILEEVIEGPPAKLKVSWHTLEGLKHEMVLEGLNNFSIKPSR